MRAALCKAYSGAGWIVFALTLVQFFLAGLGLFGTSGFDAHESVGYILHGITILVFLLALAGPRNGRDIGMGFGLVLIATIQVSLPGLRDDAPVIAAFHPLVALLILGLSAHIGRRYVGPPSARGSEPATV
jgi:Family of unknown function (DUF6220)